jgi:hypothetical protein
MRAQRSPANFVYPIGRLKIQYFRQRGEGFFLRRAGKTIPGANLLARIASEHPVPELLLHVIGDQLFLQFYRKIRNAFAAVDDLIVQDSGGWARIDTTAAGSAIVARKWVITFQRQVGNERGDEEPGAGPAIDQVSVLSHPAQAAAHGPASLQHRGAVDKSPSVHVADRFADKRQ